MIDRTIVHTSDTGYLDCRWAVADREELMLIYRCDNCGKTKELDHIAGNEFAAAKAGFQTLALVVPGVKDVCERCYKAVCEARENADRESALVRTAAMNDALRKTREG